MLTNYRKTKQGERGQRKGNNFELKFQNYNTELLLVQGYSRIYSLCIYANEHHATLLKQIIQQ